MRKILVHMAIVTTMLVLVVLASIARNDSTPIKAPVVPTPIFKSYCPNVYFCITPTK